MKRRQVLAVSASLFVAGCTGPAAGGGGGSTGTTERSDTTESGTTEDGTTTSETTDGQTTTGGEETTTASGDVSYVDTTFEVVRSACGVGVEEASVSFDGEAETVGVEGTTAGANACYSARLADATYDAAADEFRVVVEAYSDAEPGEACADCITDVEYEATSQFEGGLPGRVSVVHRSRGDEREVASASP